MELVVVTTPNTNQMTQMTYNIVTKNSGGGISIAPTVSSHVGGTVRRSSSLLLVSFINRASTAMPCYKLTVEYDGSRFSGFQRQTSNESSAATLAAANVKQPTCAPIQASSF
jgi:hypothetical protein